MNIIYALQDFPKEITKSLFLAGGTPRSPDVESWRKDAIKLLEDIGYDGTVMIPEPEDGKFAKDYQDQVEWEEKALNISDCILFWVPRDLSLDENNELKLPCLTTNVEFGCWADSGKIVYGAPKDAPKNRYLKYYAEKYNVSISDSLTDTIRNALDYLGEGAKRTDGEVNVPLFIWKLDSFQSWYKSQVDAGNRLDDATLLYSFRPKYKSFTFMWILKVDVYIASEKRHKTNEFVLSRPDISSILLWKNNGSLYESQVAIIKEFRSPANTKDGFVRELIGGSSKKTEHPEVVAAEEVLEETGLVIKKNKLTALQSRQLCATLSSHKSYLYSYELSDEELKWLSSQKDIAHGVEEDSERTYIEIHTIKELLEEENTDWSTMGQILVAWHKKH